MPLQRRYRMPSLRNALRHMRLESEGSKGKTGKAPRKEKYRAGAGQKGENTMRKYFVSFAHTKGFGNTILVTFKNLEDEIKNDQNAMHQIHKSVQEQTGLESVAILYFKRL